MFAGKPKIPVQGVKIAGEGTIIPGEETTRAGQNL